MNKNTNFATGSVIAKGVAGMRKAGRLSYENENVKRQLQKVAALFSAAENAETNVYRYKNGMATMWMIECGEEALIERANQKSRNLLRAYVELDKVCQKITGKHVLPFTEDVSVIKDICNEYLLQSTVSAVAI